VISRTTTLVSAARMTLPDSASNAVLQIGK